MKYSWSDEWEARKERVASASFCTFIVGVSSSRPSKCKVDIIAVMTSGGNLWKSGGSAAGAKCCLLDEWERLMDPRRIRLVHFVLARGAFCLLFVFFRAACLCARHLNASRLHLTDAASCCSEIRLGQKSGRTGWFLSLLPMCSWAKGCVWTETLRKLRPAGFFSPGIYCLFWHWKPFPSPKFGPEPPDSMNTTQTCLSLSRYNLFSVVSLWNTTL